MSIEVSIIKRQVQQRLEQIKQAAGARRVRVADAARDYEPFLANVATPVFRTVASVLSADGYPYKVFTPADGVRLASDRSSHSFVDLHLDSSRETPEVVVEISRERGSHILADERPLRAGASVGELTEEDVLAMLVDAIGELIER
jgi:hypothetical protein